MDSHSRANPLWLQIVPQWMSLDISPGAHVWVSLGYIPGNGIAEWEGLHICNFTNCQISLKSDCINNTSQNLFFLSLSHKPSSSPYPHVISYKSPKSSGLAGPQGKEETGSGTAETSVSWECGRGWEKFSGQHMWIIRVESDSAGWWMQLPGVPRHQSCKSWRATSFWWAREGPLNHFPK